MKKILLIVLFISVGLSQQIIPQITETYENGNIKKIIYYKETRNRIEKVKEVKYHENGQKSEEVKFKDGKEDGLFTDWYENGQKKGKVTFKDGKEDGLGTLWHENGQKKAEVTFKDGKRIGSAAEWHENGQKVAEGTYKDGKELKDGS